MPPRAFDRDATARGSCNFRDNPEREMFALQDGTLFDVQLDERLVIADGQFHIPQFSAEAGFLSDLVNRFVILINQLFGGFRR